MSEKIYAIVMLHPTPGKEARLKEVIIELANTINQKEEGCLQFQTFEQYDSETGSNVIVIQEAYANSAAVEAHMVAPYFASVAEVLQKEGLVTKPLDILKIKPFGGFNLGQK